MNLFSILEDAAKRWPEDTAVVHDGRSFRYSDLFVAAESLATKFRQAGIRVGDRVGVMCPNGPEFIVAFFSVLRGGAIAIPISPALKAGEIVQLAEEMRIDAFCYADSLKFLIPQGTTCGLIEAPILKGRAPLWLKPWATGSTSPGDERERMAGLNAACILFTSGTTSKAKGIILSHRTLHEQVMTRCTASPITRGETILWLLSMATNLVGAVSAHLLQGGKVVIADATDPYLIRKLVTEQGVAQIYGPPLCYRMLVSEQAIRPEDFRGVKYFMTTGSALPDGTAEVFRDKFGREILQRYGLSECGVVLANLSEDRKKRGSVGTPLPGCELKLIGAGTDVSGSEMGEICVRGPCLFDAYYKPWRLREEVLEGGWFRTGDLARRDADGYYWIVGRVKDVINVGGVKVFPSEIEEVLLTHPAVEEAVVFGMPEARFGEAPHAKVKLKAGATATERELMRHVNDGLSVFKWLRGVEFVTEIPKTVTGKPRRRP
jgi:long-chain acyl-CoA synthetase